MAHLGSSIGVARGIKSFYRNSGSCEGIWAPTGQAPTLHPLSQTQTSSIHHRPQLRAVRGPREWRTSGERDLES